MTFQPGLNGPSGVHSAARSEPRRLPHLGIQEIRLSDPGRLALFISLVPIITLATLAPNRQTGYQLGSRAVIASKASAVLKVRRCLGRY